MEPVVGPRRRTHHDVHAARHDHAHQGDRYRQAALEGVSERAGRGSVEGPTGCAWADRLRTWGRRRQWVGVAEPGLQRIRGDCRVPAVAAALDRDRQHARPERHGGHEHRHRHLQGTRCVPGPNFTLNSQGSLNHRISIVNMKTEKDLFYKMKIRNFPTSYTAPHRYYK